MSRVFYGTTLFLFCAQLFFFFFAERSENWSMALLLRRVTSVSQKGRKNFIPQFFNVGDVGAKRTRAHARVSDFRIKI